MEHMRVAAALARALAKEQNTRVLLEETSGALQAVRALLPGAAQLVGGSAAQLGRKRAPQADDFALVARGVHLQPTCRLQLGVRLDRLQFVGAQLVLQRQEDGLHVAATALSDAIAASPDDKVVCHLSLVHMWDEVEAKFQWRPEGHHRARKGWTMEQVQRGSVGFCVKDGGRLEAVYFAEHLLSAPLEVSGTSAAALGPGLRRFWPKACRFDDIDSLRALVSRGVTVTFMPMCDKASGNMAAQRQRGHRWATDISADDEIKKGVLYFPNNCSVHLHHRAKLQIRGLREHTMRHYAVANLLRLRGVQAQVLDRLERLLSEWLARTEGVPPAHNGVTLWDIVADVLSRMDDPRHDRPSSKSRRHADLVRLSGMLNNNRRRGALAAMAARTPSGRSSTHARAPCSGSAGPSLAKAGGPPGLRPSHRLRRLRP